MVRLHDEFGKPRAGILATGKGHRGQDPQDQFESGKDRSRNDMAPIDRPMLIGDGHVQMFAVTGHGTVQTQDFQTFVPGFDRIRGRHRSICVLTGIRHTECDMFETPHRGQHKDRRGSILGRVVVVDGSDIVFDGRHQIVPGLESHRIRNDRSRG